MAVKCRIRIPAGPAPFDLVDGNTQATTIVVDSRATLAADVIPAKEWSITDDVLNLSDCASFSIANDDGENAGKFFVGQRIEMDESDPDVAGGQWCRMFTGRITMLKTYSDLHGGSNILVAAQDLGWHLTSCHAKPLVQIRNITFQKLLDILIDPTWGFGPTKGPEDKPLINKLKHGRQVIIQNHKPQLGAILPFIQIEPSQAPFDLLKTYAAREGLLINVDPNGSLVFFRPNYTKQPLYSVQYHSSRDSQRSKNNIIGTPSLEESIDGLYSQVDCWSTVVIPPEIQNTENPNEMYRHDFYKPATNPLPFFRRHVFSDPEAINPQLRKNRAIWKHQLDMFNSWTYEVEFPYHSQRVEDGAPGPGGARFASDNMIAVNDTVNKVPPGVYYVQAVQRSLTLKNGSRTKLTIRKPGLLNPELDSLELGAGSKGVAA